jgi:ribosomal protein RSM22 (predicted rRNA methylase)
MVSKKLLKDTKKINEMARGFMKSQILLVANRLNIFTIIGEKGKTLEEIVSETDSSPRGTEILLNALTGMKFLKKEKKLYKNTDLTSALMIQGKEFYQGDMLNHAYNLWSRWGNLLESVKSGKPAKPYEELRKSSEKETRDFILAMSNIARMSAMEMVSGVDLKGYKHLLDLGGGPGTYAITFCQKNPDLKATVFDLPEVTPITDEQIIKSGLKDRVNTLSGNYLSDNFGGPYDAVIISNIIHSLGESDISIIFRKAFDCLSENGLLIVKDFYPSGNRTAPEYPLVFAVNMLVGTENGNTYTESEVKKLLQEGGFGKIKFIKLGNHSRVAIAIKK